MSAPRRRWDALRSFSSFIRPDRKALIGVLVSFAVSDLLLAVIPYFIGRFIGALAETPVDRHSALVFFWVLVGLSSLHDLGWRLSEYLYVQHVNPIKFRYETLVFTSIVRRPYHYFVDKFTGKVASYTTSLSDELGILLESAFFNYSGEAVSLIAVTGILIGVNAMTGAVFVGCLLLMYGLGRVTVRRSTEAEQDFADVKSTKNGKIIDIVGNFVSVKAFQTERVETSLVHREQSKAIESSRRSFFRGMVFWGSMSVVVRHLIWPLTIGLNFYLFLDGRESLAELTTLLSSVLLFSNFIWEIVWNLSQFNLRMARIDEAHSYLFGTENISLTATEELGRPVVPFVHSTRIEHLSFSYPDGAGHQVLSDVTLHLCKGEKVGIVGRSGSGKSTLTKLLLGYYEVEPGTLTVDGTAVTSREMAQLISFVPQDTSLFHRSIEENIRYAAAREVSRDDVLLAAQRAHADEFINQISGGYDALVGERGVKLSAGQRQRIAIARAFLDDKPLLVLDEATSALDSESEVRVQTALEELWSGKTVVAIAHRLSTLRNMDRIVVLDSGRITEQGSHNDLVASGGIYARLWEHQSGGFLPADA
ncbi:MAG: transporter related [Frankiales bacterium]|nr:transporter related [Frankiales bacterium]